MYRPDRILSLDLTKVAEDIVRQLKNLVPVRTGRLQKGIRFYISQNGAIYTIKLEMEDYFKWLKPRTRPLPAQIELCREPATALPAMNTLGLVRYSELSPRARNIMDSIDLNRALSQIDLSALQTQIYNLIDEEI